MKKVKKILITCFVMVLFIAPFVKADSGFDSGYSGGSSGGGGSYSSYSSGGSSSSSPLVNTIELIVLIIIVIYYIKSGKWKKPIEQLNTPEHPPVDYTEIKKLIPNFNSENFQIQAFNIYRDIQNAWMNFDYDTLRKYTTDEMYNMYESQLETLKVKGQRNVMGNYTLHKFDILDIVITKEDITIKTYMLISLIDFISDTNQTKVIKGNPTRTTTINYEMTFVRTISDDENKCPNCHAPLNNSASTKCEYCDSIITPKSHDFVLAKKVNKKQV